MAYVKEEEETGQPGINDPTPETPEVVSGGMSAPTAPTQGAVSPSVTPKPAASSGTYTNLQEYAEQNRPAATQMAGQVTKKTEAQAADIGQQVQQQESDFMKRVAENRTRLQQAGDTAQQQIQQAGQQDYSPEEIQKTQQLAQGQYQMEQDALNLAEQQREAQKLAKPAESAQTQAGRYDLLRKTFGDQGKQYTRGQQSLDELVLAGSDEARRQIAEAPRAAAQGLQDRIAQARRQAILQTGGLEAERQQLQTQTAEDLAAAQTGLRTQLEERLGATPDFAKGIQEGTLTQADIDQLGLEGGKLYGVDPLAYLREASMSNIATQDDLARAQALAAIGGGTQQIIADPSAVGMTDAYGIEGLKEAIASGKGAYEEALVDPTRNLENLQRVQAGLGGIRDQLDARYKAWDEWDTGAKPIYSGDRFLQHLGQDDIAEGERWARYMDRNPEGGQLADQTIKLLQGTDASQRRSIINALQNSRLSMDSAMSSIINPYQQQLSDLEKQYGTVLSPAGTGTPGVIAADGAVKTEELDTKIAVLKKMLGE